MKIAIYAFVAIAGFLYYQWACCSISTPKDAPVKQHGDIRPLSIPIITYKRVHGEYPNTISDITTPIAYILEIPSMDDDGYDINLFIKDDNMCVIYTTGLDGGFSINKDTNISDYPLYTYDPTNGSRSSGDIIRITENLQDEEQRLSGWFNQKL
jgi:hypothetical protein